ncbi:I78 family peptidase inhibitor [Pseudotabrizicola sp. L79]|uniref:I78 family peptidase inhibitor n=1 Tax=Pseudotabrizicola sp. L79 TaxID=3118402 RepID=UPI002F930D1E
MGRGSGLGLALLLAGCVAPEGPDRVPPERGACGAGELQGLVGQSGDVLARMTLPEGTRIIGPVTAVTMDYRPDRLNIDLDAAGRITRVHCT